MKKRIISALTALFIIFSASAAAFADTVRVFDEVREETEDDLAFEDIYREAAGVCVSSDYCIQYSYIFDLPRISEEFGFEILKPSYRNYTFDERLDIFDGFLSRMNELDYKSLSLKNQFDFDFLKEYLETELMLRSVPHTDFGCLFESAFEGNTPISDMWRIIYGPEALTEQYIIDLVEGLRAYGDYVRDGCEHELKRLEAGLVISRELTESQIELVSEMLRDALNDPDNYMIIGDPPEDYGVTEETLAEYNEQIREITPSAIAAFERMLETLETIKNAGVERRGLCAYEGGERYYKYLIRKRAGIKIDDLNRFYDEIKAIYADEITAYVEIIGDPERMAELDEPYAYDFENMTEEEVFDLWVKLAEKHYPEPVTTEHVLKHFYNETDSIAAQFDPPRYGRFDNLIEINDSNNNFLADNKFSAAEYATTIAHEGIPGHMYHFNKLMAQGDLLKYFLLINPHEDILNSFAEGWAYSNEARLYNDISTNETQKCFLRLIMKYNTLCVDALQSMRLNINGLTPEEYCECINEKPGYEDYDFYMEHFASIIDAPVNKLMMYVGWDAFDNAYDRAREALGSDFDETEYNQFLMDLGLCDMETLEKWEGIWIEKVLAAHAEIPETPDNPQTGVDFSLAMFIAVTAGATALIARKKH